MRSRIREPLARRALDTVLETVSQYGTWIATIGIEDPSELRRYKRLSALADYLESLLGQEKIVVELESKEANLLVSCAANDTV